MNDGTSHNGNAPKTEDPMKPTCDGCNAPIRPVDYPYTVCMPCTMARAKSVAKRGVCVCRRRERRETEVMGNPGQRRWVACRRCLGTVRQVA